MKLVMLAPTSFQLPEPMSSVAPVVDTLYMQIYWLSVVFFVGIVGAMLYLAWKYRKRPGHKAEAPTHSVFMDRLELFWTVAPIFILIPLFHEGFKGYMDLSIAPSDAIEIRVRAKQWGWNFEYPNGESSDVLHVPANKNVKMVMSSDDVLHAFFIPEFRVKRDLVPGMYTSVWFRPTVTGEADLFCAEYCGGLSKDKQTGAELSPDKFSGHWSMITKVKIETPEAFEKYIDSLGMGAGTPTPEALTARGKVLYGRNACVGCHSIDGTKSIGPTWKGMFGKPHKMSDGTDVVADENYVRESILTPNAKVVQGYASPSQMPTYQGQLKDRDIDAIIAFIKSLKAN